MRSVIRLFFALALGGVQSLNALDFSGFAAVESRFYKVSDELQHAFLLEPELSLGGAADSNAISLRVFHRADEANDARSHTDLRELLWRYSPKQNWALNLGVGRVFWGVAESAHLVDIVNQTDNLEGFDGEDKLGQPMLRWSGFYHWGTVDAFILPYFRERQFSSLEGGLPASFEIDTESSAYESGGEQKHTDLALRYSRSVGGWGFGLSYFSGTNRDPYLRLVEDPPAANEGGAVEDGEDEAGAGEAENEGELVDTALEFRPHYTQISQYSLDLQARLGAYLWKLEAIQREDVIDRYTAAVFGLEYTFRQIFGSSVDLGLLAEKHHDSRGESANSAMQDDIFLGLRLDCDNPQATGILIGLTQDLDDGGRYSAVIEASRRIGRSFRVSLDALLVHNQNSTDPLNVLDDDDHLSFLVEYYY